MEKDTYEQLLSYRESRANQFNTFVQTPSFEAMMYKLVAFLMDDDSSKIRLTIKNAAGETSFTDGKNIELGMPTIFFAPQYGPLDWATVFKTLLVHEVQHINSSNFSDIKKIKTFYANHTTSRIPKKTAEKIAKDYLNIMEDGRIEMIATHKLPGFKTPFRFFNLECRKFMELEPPLAAENEMTDFQNNVLSYCTTGLQMPNIELYHGTRFEEKFESIRHYLDAAVYAKKSSDCRIICQQFLTELTDYFLDLLSANPPDDDDDTPDQPEEYTSNNEQEYANPNDFSDNSLRSPSITPEELSALHRGIQDELAADSVVKRDACPVGQTRIERKREALQEYYKNDPPNKFEEEFPDISNAPLPPDVVAGAKRLERTLEKILTIKCTERRNIRHGRLDARALYRTGLQDSHIFMKKGKPISADMSVFLLLDNSGSMSGHGAIAVIDGQQEPISKSNLARMAASQIEYALRKFAPTKISLFDSDNKSVRHFTIKDFDEATAGGKCYNSILSVGTGCGNKDGYSIRVATDELLERKESKRILIILSDGMPSDYADEASGMEDVRLAVKEARKKGIQVIPIMFGDSSFREKSANLFAYMYQTFISCSPNKISEEFQKLFTNLIKKS